MNLGIRPDLIGVIDLKDGKAVHAIAGRRDEYQPITRAESETINGDPHRLADFYLRLGVTRFYVADLNGILNRETQVELIGDIIEQLKSVSSELLLDVGIHERFNLAMAKDFVSRWPTVKLIAATESASSVACLKNLANAVSSRIVYLGLDYRNGEFIGQSEPEDQWLAEAARLKIGGVVGLDVTSVGTGSIKSTAKLCSRLSKITCQHNLSLISGGGVRNVADVESLKRAGCHGVLVASSLLKLGEQFFD